MNDDGRLRTLSLFSGIGGIDLALRPWARTVAYCEADRWATGVLLSRMASGELDTAPVHHDVRTLDAACLRSAGIEGVDLIAGGFPCQDISTAGLGRGLAGERSGLFFEIARLAGELRPRFIFLENVAAILGRGVDAVLGTLDTLGYDARWCILSAADVGAPHRRERWWCVAHANDRRGSITPTPPTPPTPPTGGAARSLPLVGCDPDRPEQSRVSSGDLADTDSQRRAKPDGEPARTVRAGWQDGQGSLPDAHCVPPVWASESRGQRRAWPPEPPVGRVAHGVSRRVDRIRGLGNAVVPQAAAQAFRYLMGLEPLT